jgi:hydroxyacylglutathione hydrolase
LLSGQPTVPRYFARMRPMNQAGPPLLGGVVPEVPALSGDGLDRPLGRGALVVDARSPYEHAREAIRGSLSIPAGSSFGTWLGWVVDPDRPIVLLVEDPADLDDLARQALRIGFDPFVGYIDGGIDAWRRAGRPVDAGAVLTVETLGARLAGGGPEAPFVIDVRQPSEYEAGHVPGSTHIGAGELPEMLDRLPRDRPIATICASGYRSSVAASMLRAAGFEDVVTVASGVPTWEAHGFPVAYGPESGSGDWPAATAAAGEPHQH